MTAEPLRIVPGAPPPKEISKSTRKKRKTKPKAEATTPDVLEPSSAAFIEKAPEPSEIQSGAVAPELVVQPESETPPIALSPIVDLVHKRLKVTSKKISRISTYASTDPEKLNEDQKATLKTLPALEAVQKELGEVKKAVEVHEAQLVAELTQKRQEAEKSEQARIASAVSVAENAALIRASELLNFLRLRSLLASGDVSLGLESAEVTAVFSAGEALLAEAGENKQAVLTGFMLGQGSYGGISYARLLEITQLDLNPPRVPTPTEENSPKVATETTEASVEDMSASNQPVVVSTSGSFDFMQASELEPPFEESAEWVERSDAAGHPEEQVEEPVNGHIPIEEPTATPSAETINAALDWAADDEEGGLPPIAGLHAKFGTSGSATPIVVEELQTNGHSAATAPAAAEEDDGFTQARGSGRARGFRGGERGGERGGFRGGFRGGDRPFRGVGDRGSRGGYRGRGGEWRGDGERGRGGRGRGRGDRGGGPQ
ncbi:hypothetical protein DFH07DRAFT_249200 [Mycena maculata]|uniref:Uncharacterized protein n=1 Tax=Mycena maculata TaxID=230809 RepID=A0AAD7MNQ9_9AGAR|nr:hypothetical protein DFH07DRAFT_249200 [Mycena maculata]